MEINLTMTRKVARDVPGPANPNLKPQAASLMSFSAKTTQNTKCPNTCPPQRLQAFETK
jgi:hypothetical protein